ncbi:hypothetical protein [Candidatus Puniceispirillum sp.]|uniref:hypothetical protein n=2 Tax=Candidatus Puniceispirillum TaxID=767891 RepID=UPI001EBE432A|nr:hypothetical protein [Candidatus Puniceispirillum sp.]MBT6565680.1 hypothetical protein [Candidatus Puniceispirillum sp.]
MQTDRNTDLTTLSDLNNAVTGTAFFDATTANKPNDVNSNGIVNTIYQGDIGWQMLIANDAPREFWQRTRKPATPYWRNWRRFADFRTVNDAIDAALATASQADAETVKSLIAEHGAAEVSARDATIASAVSSAVNDIPQGLDRAAVESIVDTKLDSELDDERTARNDAINTAVNAATTAIITGRKGAIETAIATERAAIDRAVDSKTGIIDAKVTTLDAKLESERDAHAAALRAQRIELKNAIANIIPDFDTHMASIIQTERSDRTAAIVAEADQRKIAITHEAETRDNAIRGLDTKLMGDIAAARRAISGDITTAVATERDARKAADRAVTTQIANSGFPSGTKMLFQQSNAPTGWTKDTAHNDKALRIVSGSVGSGGSVSFKAALSHRRVDGNISNKVSGSVAGHAITVAQMPHHLHGMKVGYDSGSHPDSHTSSRGRLTTLGGFYYTDNSNMRTKSTGGNQPHSHGAGSLSVTSTFRGLPIDMRVRYVDVIIATKD